MAKEKREKVGVGTIRIRKVIVIVMVVLLILAGAYILERRIKSFNQVKSDASFQEGVQYGFDYAKELIYQEAVQCTPFPLSHQDKAINLIAVECLQ